MCSTTTPGCLPGSVGQKYSQCTVLLLTTGVTKGEGNVTFESCMPRAELRTGTCSNVNVAGSRRKIWGSDCSDPTGSKCALPERACGSSPRTQLPHRTTRA